jgi:molecular chaperone Hsp33
VSEVDSLRRFIFEEAPLRGHWVRLQDSWAAAREHQAHPLAVRSLLGQTLAAASLLAATLKFKGTLTLQVHSTGSLSMLIAQATHEQQVRAMAQVREGAVVADDSDFRSLVGEGRLVVTVDTQDDTPPWQGVVPLTGETLAASLEYYFEHSEQLATRLLLAADDQQAGGLLLQRLPAQAGEASAAQWQVVWEEASLFMGTVAGPELLATPITTLLPLVFGEHDIRLFDATDVRYRCRCDRQRVGGLLRSLGEAESREVLAELGAITVTCEFCQKPYRFDVIDVEQLFAPVPLPTAGQSLN